MMSLASFRGSALGRRHQLVDGRHKLFDFQFRTHAADTVIAAGNNAHQFAIGRAILSDRHSGVTSLFLKRQDIRQCMLRRDIAVADDKAGFVSLHPGNHCRFFFNGLRTVNKRYAAFLGQRDGHGIVGYGLHNCRNHRDIHGNGAFLAFTELDQWRFQTHPVRDALCTGISGYQEIFAECMGRFFKKLRHVFLPPVSI